VNDRPGTFEFGRFAVLKEEHADGQPVVGGELEGVWEADACGFFAEERLRDLQGQAGTVAGFATDTPAVFEGPKGEQGFLNNLGTRFPVFGGHATDATGIGADVVGVEQLTGADEFETGVHPGTCALRGVGESVAKQLLFIVAVDGVDKSESCHV
jgi:hypothetical protein